MKPYFHRYTMVVLSWLLSTTPMYPQTGSSPDMESIPVPGNAPFSVLIDAAMFMDFSAPTGKRPGPALPASNTNIIWQNSLPLKFNELDAEPYLSSYLMWTISELERYTAVMPHDAHGLTALAVKYYQSGKTEDCIKALANARVADPFYERSAEIYSAVLIHAGDLIRAERESRRMLDELPHNPVLRFNVACGYALLTNTTEALYHLGVLTNAGWQSIRYYLHDPDLDSLRITAAFQELVDQQDQLARNQIANTIGVSP